MLLPKDIMSGAYKKPNIYLCEADKSRICKLETSNMSGTFKFNSYSELTFDVARVYNDLITGQTKTNPYYNKVEAVRLVLLDGFGYFELQDPEIEGDGIKEVKSLTAYSSEYTLSQKYLENFYINTGKVDSIEVLYAEEHGNSTIIPVTFYNPNKPQLSLLHLILEKAYGWKIGHVDTALKTMSRQFEVPRESVYDFIMNEICKKFNCYAVFDTFNNEINFYAESLTNKFIGDGTTKIFNISPKFPEIKTVSVDGYKTISYKYNPATGVLTLDTAPSKGAMVEVTDGSLSDWETDVFVTFDNLAQQMNINYSSDDIKTVLTVKGADELDIREVNNGLPYIVDLSYFYNVDWMGQDLYDAYTKYLSKCTQSQARYKENSQKIIEFSNRILYETNRLSLQYSEASVSAETVGAYYVRGGDATAGYFYTEVSLPADYIAGTTYYSTLTTDLNEEKISDLYKALQTYYSTGEVTDFDDELIKAFDFTKVTHPKGHTLNGVKTTLADKNKTDTVKSKKVTDFLAQVWTQLGLTPLKTLYLTPYKEIQTTNVSAGWAEKNNDNYGRYYPVVLIIKSLNAAIEKRQATIDGLVAEQNKYSKENADIGESLLLTNNFTPEQQIRLSAFLREDEYTDSNFVATGNESTEELFKLKQELLECGRIELSKLCEPCLKFSMSLANIYALPEFEPIVNQFQLGNLIKIALRPDYIKHTRLMQVDLNFEDFSDFSCEFGDLMSIRSQTDLHADLLSQAVSAGKTVASNASYWNKGTDIATDIDLRVQQGLLNAATEIKSIDGNQNVVIDNYGIHLQEKDPNTGEISDKQGWIVNNKFLYSDDAFDTAKSVFGEYTIDGQKYWGLLAEAVIAGYIEGSTIKGGTIDIGNGTFVVDSNGSVTMNAGSIAGYATSSDLEDMVGRISLAGKTIDLTSDNISIKSTNFNVTPDGTITAKNANITGDITANSLTLGSGASIPYSKVSGTPDLSVYIAKDGTVGSTPASGSTGFKVSKSGLLQASNAVIYGTLYSSAGTIAGWTIDSSSFAKTITANSVDYNVFMQAGTGTGSSAFAVRKKSSSNSSWDYQFQVTYGGKLTAKNANITGDITANSLSLGSGVTVPYSKISGTPDLSVYIAKDGTVGSTPKDGATGFKVSKSGLLTASNAVIYGDIYASGGTIAGYTIGSGGVYGNAIYKRVTGSSAKYEVGMKASSGETDLAFYVKKSTDSWASNSNVFYVNNSGKLYAQNADIKGKITATSGEFAGSLKGASGTFTALTAGTDADGLVKVNTNGIKIGKTSTGYALIGDPDFTEDNTGQVWKEITIRPSAHEIGNIGTNDHSWDTLTVRYAWIRDGVSQSSDRNVKKDIVLMGDVQEQLFNDLKPVTFKFTNGTSGRTHYGFISQDVEDSLHNIGLTGTDFAGFCKDTYTDANNEETEKYSLRYSEFVALNTHMIQKLRKEIQELKKEVQELKKINSNTSSNNGE